jgi:hypothetical protein
MDRKGGEGGKKEVTIGNGQLTTAGSNGKQPPANPVHWERILVPVADEILVENGINNVFSNLFRDEISGANAVLSRLFHLSPSPSANIISNSLPRTFNSCLERLPHRLGFGCNPFHSEDYFDY